MGLPTLIDWKKNNYNSIFNIVNWLIKIMYYKLIKISINDLSFTKIFINIVMKYYSFSVLIFTGRSLLYISKFWSLLFYFIGNKQRLFTTFYLWINGHTKKQNNIIKIYS